jgi:hypothetical protein
MPNMANRANGSSRVFLRKVILPVITGQCFSRLAAAGFSPAGETETVSLAAEKKAVAAKAALR